MAEIIRTGSGNFGNYRLLRLNSDLVPHAHPEGQIVFALDQHISDIVLVNDQPILLDVHTAVFANPMEKHSHKIYSGEAEYLVLYFEPNWLSEMFGQRSNGRVFLKNRIALDRKLTELVHCLRSAADNQTSDEVSLWVEKIAVELRQHTAVTNHQEATQDAPWRMDKVEQAIASMTKNLLIHRDINLIAREIGVSRPQLFKLFRTQLKTTPNISWNALRMEYAKKRLLDSEISVEALAGEIGFSEPANFSRFFKHHAGFNPSQFRQANKSQLVSGVP